MPYNRFMQLTRPSIYLTKVSDKYYLSESEKFLLVHLELVNPDRITFAAGQYVSIKINEHGERRSYSIASTSDMNHGITLVVEIIPNGKGSEYLKNLLIGDEVELLAPMGRFTVTNDTATQNLLFVATGSGIVPIKAMIEELLIVKRDMRQIRLHWGMRSEEDMFWFDNFQRLAGEHPNFVFDQVLSKPSADWELCTGHVQDCLARDFPEGLSDWEAYVCGSPETVRAIENKLLEMKVDPDRIHMERFS